MGEVSCAAKNFQLGDILTITTGKLVTPRGMEGIYDILNFMTGDSLYTHQLPRAFAECKPYLLRQHPELAEVRYGRGAKAAAVRNWLDEQIKKFGEELSVESIPLEGHERANPLEELVEMRSGKQVVVVGIDETGVESESAEPVASGLAL